MTEEKLKEIYENYVLKSLSKSQNPAAIPSFEEVIESIEKHRRWYDFGLWYRNKTWKEVKTTLWAHMHNLGQDKATILGDNVFG